MIKSKYLLNNIETIKFNSNNKQLSLLQIQKNKIQKLSSFYIKKKKFFQPKKHPKTKDFF